MNYLIFNSLPEKIEAPIERLLALYQYFKNSSQEVKIISLDHHLALHSFIERYLIDPNDFINLFEYYQESTNFKGKQRWYYELPSPKKMEIFGTYHHANVQDGSIERVRMDYQPTIVGVERYVKNANYRDRNGQDVVIDKYDWRGFLSSTLYQSEGKGYAETFYNPKGQEKFQIYYSVGEDGSRYISSVRKFNDNFNDQLLNGIVSLNEQFIRNEIKNDSSTNLYFFETNGRATEFFNELPNAKKILVVNHDFKIGDGKPTQISQLTSQQNIDEIIVDNPITQKAVAKAVPEFIDKIKVLHGDNEKPRKDSTTLTEIFKNDDPSIVLLVHGKNDDDVKFKQLYDLIKTQRENGNKFNVYVIRKWGLGDNLKNAVEEKNEWFKATYNPLNEISEARQIAKFASDSQMVVDLSDDQGASYTITSSIELGIPVLFNGNNGMANSVLNGENGLADENFDLILTNFEKYLIDNNALKLAQKAASETKIPE
ncbi:MAG: hypothetical protein LBC17_02600 [Lactobacillaceae bacterium]|jgi:hypothetical protein|nr:hypothetical protein [Lactobacillaceae bacterium]